MKQVLEIEVPDGKKAIWKDNKIVFEDIKPQLPKTWEEFCEQNMVKRDEYYLDASSCITEFLNNGRNIYTDRNVLPNKQAAEQHLALMQLHQLRDCYRQGWTPRWNNFKTDRYCIEFMDNHYTIDHYTIFKYNTSNKFLSFQSREIAQEFLTNFRDLIEQAGDLI